jgi:hypothetical protein
VTRDQYLDIVEAVDGPDQEWHAEAAREFARLPADAARARKSDSDQICPGCGRSMGGRARRTDPVHLLMPDLELACDTASPWARSSSIPAEVDCTSCMIAMLRAELSK